MGHFEKLNCTLSNKDTRAEHALLPAKAKRVFSIGGSGARILEIVLEIECLPRL